MICITLLVCLCVCVCVCQSVNEGMNIRSGEKQKNDEKCQKLRDKINEVNDK